MERNAEDGPKALAREQGPAWIPSGALEVCQVIDVWAPKRDDL